MLTRLDIRSFKAFGEPATEVGLTPFMLVVGENGAGKTSILQAIELLGLLTRGNLQQALEQRAWDYGDLVHLKSSTKTMRFVAHVLLAGDELVWTLELGKRRRSGIAAETVVRDGEVLLSRDGRTMARRDETTRKMVDQVKQTLTTSWLAAVEEEDEDRFPTLARLAGWARGVRPYVVLDPLVLREPSASHPDGLGIHGEGLQPSCERCLSGGGPRCSNARSSTTNHSRIFVRCAAVTPALPASTSASDGVAPPSRSAAGR